MKFISAQTLYSLNNYRTHEQSHGNVKQHLLFHQYLKLLAVRQNHLHTHALCNDYLQIPE